MNYQKGLYLLIKNVASNLGCRSPASYGDGSLEAIENVLKEILEEHGSIEKSKMEDLNVASEKSKQQYDKALETIESLKESVYSIQKFNLKIFIHIGQKFWNRTKGGDGKVFGIRIW